MSSEARDALVVLVATDGFFLDLEMIEQLLSLARVFAGDAVNVAQNFKRAQSDVAKVADGSGDEVEAGSKIRCGTRIFLARHGNL